MARPKTSTRPATKGGKSLAIKSRKAPGKIPKSATARSKTRVPGIELKKPYKHRKGWTARRDFRRLTHEKTTAKNILSRAGVRACIKHVLLEEFVDMRIPDQFVRDVRELAESVFLNDILGNVRSDHQYRSTAVKRARVTVGQLQLAMASSAKHMCHDVKRDFDDLIKRHFKPKPQKK